MRDTTIGDCGCIGVIEGIEKLKLWFRPRWKVAKKKPGGNWYPVAQVVDRIEQLLLVALPPEPKRKDHGIDYLTLEERLSLGKVSVCASKWVGATEDIDDLRINTRDRWQVTNTR